MTEVKEFQVLVRMKGSNAEPWKEKIEIPVNQNPKAFMEKLVKEFNKEEDRRATINKNYSIQYREFVGFVGETGKQKTYCDLQGQKFNTVTMFIGIINYDILRCPNCKKFYQRIGLGEGFNYDSQVCQPELLCHQCNKTFNSAKLLENHNKIGKHKTPKWLIKVTNLTGGR